MKLFKNQKISEMTDAELEKAIKYQRNFGLIFLALSMALLGIIGINSYITQQVTIYDAIAVPLVFLANVTQGLVLMIYGFEQRIREIKT